MKVNRKAASGAKTNVPNARDVPKTVGGGWILRIDTNQLDENRAKTFPFDHQVAGRSLLLFALRRTGNSAW